MRSTTCPAPARLAPICGRARSASLGDQFFDLDQVNHTGCADDQVDLPSSPLSLRPDAPPREYDAHP